MFQRAIINNIREWAKKTNRKPLILRGARQVGKTTVVKLISAEFEQFISLNLEKPEHRNIFERESSFSDLLSAIFYSAKQQQGNHRTLIFIDEIQNSPKAVASLRYFYEEAPQYAVIAAGSLLENLIDHSISFPVGRVEYMAMRPCSFIEFLSAAGEEKNKEFIEHLSVPAYAHENLMKLFNRFTLIGGMPEVISTYVSTKDVITLNPVYETLINGYSDDVEKYARNESMVQHIRHILKTGFGSASQRIKFEGFGQSNYRSREMGEAFRTLEKAMLLELIYPLTTMKPPLNPDFKKSPRLQWLDTGLVNYFSGIQHDVFMSKEIIELYKGSIAEHIVGQEMLSHDYSFLSKRFFWVREKPTATAEIDFILPYKSLFIPVEVKSGKSGRLRSLHYYMDQSSVDVAVRIGSAPYSIEDIETPEGKKFQLIHLPFYLISVIEKIIEKMI